MSNWWSSMVVRLLFILYAAPSLVDSVMNYTNKWQAKITYPDLRGESRNDCGKSRSSFYICDPDSLINDNDAKALESRLHRFAVETKCKCQRKSQCVAEDENTDKIEVGFVIAVAFARYVAKPLHQPNASVIQQVSDQFCKDLRGQWALGDCGNSAIILVWAEYDLVYFLPDRLMKKYVTQAESDQMIKRIKQQLVERKYRTALEQMLNDIEQELRGEEESRVDIGQLSLIISVGVAVFFVVVITGCVCAFRCCGNLRPDPETAFAQTLERMDTLKSDLLRRNDLLRQSLSRSPKQSHHAPSSGSLILPDSSPRLLPASRRFLAPSNTYAAPQPMNMARLATPYYSVEDGHSMV